MHAGLNWTVIVVVTYVRFCIMENVSADICITMAITIVLSAGTWVRLSLQLRVLALVFDVNYIARVTVFVFGFDLVV